METAEFETVALIHHFCKEYNLHQTADALCRETRLVPAQAVLADNVSLLRLLTEWKYTFQAQYNKRPRILYQEPVLRGVTNDEVAAAHNQLSSPPTNAAHMHQQHLQQQQMLQQQQQQSYQPIYYYDGNNTSYMVQGQIQQPTHSPTSSHHAQHIPQQYAQQVPQHMQVQHIPNQLQQHVQLQETQVVHPQSMHPSQQAQLPLSAQHTHMHVNSNQAHNNHHTSSGGGGSRHHREHSTGPKPAVLSVALRTGDSTERNSLVQTSLAGTTDFIDQEVFLSKILERGAKEKEVTDLFDFKKPKVTSSKRQSAFLTLSSKQHDAMYALAGCSDIQFSIAGVSRSVRSAMTAVYGIDKESFTVWFKNRGRNPSKYAAAQAAAAADAANSDSPPGPVLSKSQTKRRRESEEPSSMPMHSTLQPHQEMLPSLEYMPI